MYELNEGEKAPDVVGLGDDGVVVVGIQSVPSSLLETTAILQTAAHRVETLNFTGAQGVGGIDPSDAGLGEKLGIVVGVEVVDINFETVDIDEILGAELRPFEQLAEVG